VAEIPHTLFQNPGAVPLVAVVREQFASWLRLLDLDDAEAKSLSNRLPNYLAFAFHEEWRFRRDHYQPVFEHYEGPFTAAAQMAWDWERNRLMLIRQFDEPVFEETFSLREVYVPLRAHWREEAKVRKPRPDDRIHIVDLREAIEDWLKPAEHDDAIRVVSGGPGSGKSSFAKKLAADLCETSQMRVLFFPLQRFPTDKPLQEAMRIWLVDSGSFAESPIRQANFASKVNQLLLIFDGLDELTKPGDLADKMTREFVQEVRANLGVWNAQERRVLVLITGRTIVAQQHRHGLGLGEAQSLAVLPYLLEEGDREEMARREKAKSTMRNGLSYAISGGIGGEITAGPKVKRTLSSP
jgi:adenylate kinase family enzyme